MCLLLTVLCAAIAAESHPAENEPEVRPLWNFRLLPKAFQKNPIVDMTVITEMTEEGRLRPPPSSENPVSYSLLSAGYRRHGEVSGETRSFSQTEVEDHLNRSLAAGGFRAEENPDHPPSLLIVYSWGVHGPLEEGDAGNQMNRVKPSCGTCWEEWHWWAVMYSLRRSTACSVRPAISGAAFR